MAVYSSVRPVPGTVPLTLHDARSLFVGNMKHVRDSFRLHCRFGPGLKHPSSVRLRSSLPTVRTAVVLLSCFSYLPFFPSLRFVQRRAASAAPGEIGHIVFRYFPRVVPSSAAAAEKDEPTDGVEDEGARSAAAFPSISFLSLPPSASRPSSVHLLLSPIPICTANVFK